MPRTYAGLSSINDQIADGFAGAVGSITYVLAEIERHHHSYERWYGAAITPVGETHIADRLGPGVGPFQVDAGNNDWGAWLQIIGSEDLPAIPGEVKYDPNTIQICGAQWTDTYFIQIAFGETGGIALAENKYTEHVFRPQSVQGKPAPMDIRSRRHPSETKAWIRILVNGRTSGTLDFFIGTHEYGG